MIRHNSRESYHRSPQGAQPVGATVTLRLECSGACDSATLRLWWDDKEHKLPMKKDAPGVYAARFALPDHPGLLWYHFILQMTDGRTLYYGNAHDHLGGEGALYDHEPPGYQLTVYARDYETPAFLRDGVMYHIMVDRFHAGTPACERSAPEGGHWHEDWYEPPELNLCPDNSDNIANDFYGGNLEGIRQKLPYLRDLGVTVLYLSPIFRARSNHKYNTGDYMQIDPSFGTERDFQTLCQDAATLGIRVILDGVFSHTGSDSRYFNKNATYDSLGAYQSKESPYYSWYRFYNWPDQYESWWGFDTLPVLNKTDPSYLDFMILDDDAASAHWIRRGASGWRLDVADELPMGFLRMLRVRIKCENPEGVLLGEVWEDASCKIAYDELRSYCLGDTLDSCMNYPLRDALFDFLLDRSDSTRLLRRLEHMQENYPEPFFYSLMNLVSSHDKARAISVLADCGDMEPPRAQRRPVKMSRRDYNRGKKRLLLAWQFINALPGMPCMYYGDEAGLTGMADPFCRGTYPWGREDARLLRKMRRITQTRKSDPVWSRGALKLYAPHRDVVVAVRSDDNSIHACAINRGSRKRTIQLPPDETLHGGLVLTIDAMSSEIIRLPSTHIQPLEPVLEIIK